MEIKSDINPITITDNHPTSSYGIPVVIFDGNAYGDNDVIDSSGGSVLTGRQAKVDIATRGARTESIDAKTYNWIVKGTGFMSHDEYVKHLADERKKGGLYFGK